MSDSSANLDLPFLLPSQAQKHVTHNEALMRLDTLVQLRLDGVGSSLPPVSPAEGETHALTGAATGAWAGQQAGTLARWDGVAWMFLMPRVGWRGWDVAGAQIRVWDGADWTPARPSPDTVDQLGVGTDADAVNRLSVASEATLFTHAGAGHQLKINKAAPADTASLLFQSGWSGHAEMGLAGGTDWSIKVSPDGAAWTEALVIDAATGLAAGAAVQADVTDAGTGRLLKVGAFGLGSTDNDTVRVDNGAQDLPSGFFAGSGSTSDPATFPDDNSRYNPFLNLTRRVSAGAYDQTRLFFSTDGMNVQRKQAAGPWEELHALYSRQNAVGSVGQSGGIPTGAMIESGSNGDGAYLLLADGTMFCWGRFSQSAISCSIGFAGGFRSSTASTVPFPMAFASAPDVQFWVQDVAASDALPCGVGGLTGAGFSPRIWRALAGTANFSGAFLAVGRWF